MSTPSRPESSQVENFIKAAEIKIRVGESATALTFILCAIKEIDQRDKAAADVVNNYLKVVTENGELRNRLKTPEPNRDFVNEFNDLLRAKDVEHRDCRAYADKAAENLAKLKWALRALLACGLPPHDVSGSGMWADAKRLFSEVLLDTPTNPIQAPMSVSVAVALTARLLLRRLEKYVEDMPTGAIGREFLGKEVKRLLTMIVEEADQCPIDKTIPTTISKPTS